MPDRAGDYIGLGFYYYPWRFFHFPNKWQMFCIMIEKTKNNPKYYINREHYSLNIYGYIAYSSFVWKIANEDE